MSRPRMLTSVALAAACWLTAADGLSDGVINPDDMFWLAAAVTVTLAAVLLQGFSVLARYHQDEAQELIGVIYDDFTRRRGGGPPTGPIPAAREGRPRVAA